MIKSSADPKEPAELFIDFALLKQEDFVNKTLQKPLAM